MQAPRSKLGFGWAFGSSIGSGGAAAGSGSRHAYAGLRGNSGPPYGNLFRDSGAFVESVWDSDGNATVAVGGRDGCTPPYGNVPWDHETPVGASFWYGGGEHKGSDSHLRGGCGPQDLAKWQGVALQEAAAANVTTIMVRNLTHRVTLEGILAELDNSIFRGLYDFAYLPTYHKSNKHRGFAFIDFHSPEVACRFMKEWHNAQRFGTAKLNLKPATTQGLHDNLTKFEADPDTASIIRKARRKLFIRPNTSAGTSSSAASPASDVMQIGQQMVTPPQPFALPMPDFFA